jgi:tetratricopeptide (TPR) repeat protein
MLKKTLALVSFCFFFVLGSHPAMAQFGQMRGSVINEDGTPFVGAEILIDREDIRGHYELKTDKNGRFFHAGLPLGRYSVSVIMSNGQPFSIGNVQTNTSDPAIVEIDLQQERMRTEAAAAGVQVGEGELSPEQIAAIEKASAERAELIKQRQELTGRFDEAMTAMAAKDYDTAIPAFEAAAEVDPTQHVIFAQLGEAFSGKATAAGNSAEKKEWYEKAAASYEKSLTLKPEDPSYHNNFALALANGGKIAEAQAELEKAAELDPVNGGRYYFNLGAVLINTGNIDAAIDAFRKATEADQNFADAFYQLGVTLTGQATVDNATGKVIPSPGTLEALQKYIDLAPDGPNAAAAKSLIDTMGGAVTTSVDLSKD